MVGPVTVTGANPGEFFASVPAGCASIVPAGSCTIGVTFSPASVGGKAATVNIAHNAAGSPALVTLTGTGVAAPPPPPPPTLGFPTAVTVVSGSSPSGSAANLGSVNGSVYSLRSPFLGSPSWYGTFGVVPTATDFKVTYNGSSTRTCTLSLAIYQWTTNTWVAAGSSVSVGTSAVTVANAAPSAAIPAANLRSATGQVRVRASCSAGFSFSTYTLSSDLLQLSYSG